jgi:hypothetical protein
VTVCEPARTLVLVPAKISLGDAESQGDLAHVGRHDDTTFGSGQFRGFGKVGEGECVDDEAVL